MSTTRCPWVSDVELVVDHSPHESNNTQLMTPLSVSLHFTERVPTSLPFPISTPTFGPRGRSPTSPGERWESHRYGGLGGHRDGQPSGPGSRKWGPGPTTHVRDYPVTRRVRSPTGRFFTGTSGSEPLTPRRPPGARRTRGTTGGQSRRRKTRTRTFVLPRRSRDALRGTSEWTAETFTCVGTPSPSGTGGRRRSGAGRQEGSTQSLSPT